MNDPSESSANTDSLREERLQQVLDDCIGRRAAGEQIADEQMIADHADLMPELEQRLKALRMIQDARQRIHDPSTDSVPALTIGHGLHIRCPHCHQPIELVDDDPAGDVTCSSCGSSFNLVDDVGDTYISPTLANIAHFETIEQIGVGAFGTVWKARDTQLDRTVAIKVPRKGQLSPEETGQFLREARAAAQLHHPNIVTVHEVGRQDEVVYIVSDYVRGITLADWLSGQNPSSEEAAVLCVKIAAALHHAHESGVVHRDLKPANIMIDAAGEPHIMDFGLAKRDAGEITMTLEGAMLGTPAYMSPEQAKGEAHQVDGRSDVYSLGVILFELLTGELPFRGNRNMLIFQVINEEAPNPGKLNSSVPRDLATICLKCLEKQPAGRYQSAAELAAELGRFLEARPILARPITRPARLWRWSRRNPVLAAVTATSLVLLMTLALGGPLVALEQARLRQLADDETDRADAERDNAREELKEHGQTLRVYVETIGEAELLKDPRFAPLKQKLLKDVLAHYQRFLARHRDDPQWAPEVARALFDVARISVETLGASREDALTAYQEALAVYERLARENPTVTEYQYDMARSHHNIGHLYSVTGNLAEALTEYQKAQKILVPLSRENPTVSKYESVLGESHIRIGALYERTGKPAEALVAHQKALHIQERLAHENPTVTAYQSRLATIYGSMGLLYSRTGKLDEALTTHRKALKIWETLARQYPTVPKYESSLVGCGNNIGNLYLNNDNMAEALAAFQKIVMVQERLVRENPTIIEYRDGLAIGHHNVGTVYSRTGRPAEALASHQKALEIRERLFRENPTVTHHQNSVAQSHNYFGSLYQKTGKLAEALASYQHALEIRETLARQNPTVANYESAVVDSRNNIGLLYGLTGEPAKALAAYQAALEIRRRLASENPTITEYQNRLAIGLYNLGSLYDDMGELDKALAAEQQALEIWETLARKNAAVTEYRHELAKSHSNLGVLYIRFDKPDEALAAHQQALEIWETLTRENSTVTEYAIGVAASLTNLADLNGTQDAETALANLSRASSILNGVLKREPQNVLASNFLRNAHKSMGKVYSQTGQRAEALTAYQKAVDIFERLTRENPTVAEHGSNLAKFHNDIGLLYKETGKPAEALAAFQKALEIQEPLFRENPTVTKYATYLAGTLVNSARLKGTTDSEIALARLRRAISILNDVLKREPRNVTALEFLTHAHDGIGIVESQSGQPPVALARYQKAIEKLETLARENPIVDKYWSELAKRHMGIGVLYETTGKPAEALAAYQKAIEILESLLRDNPTNTEYATYLAGNLLNVANLNKTKDPETAQAGLGRAISLLSDVLKREPRNVKAQKYLGYAHKTCGLVYRQTGKPEEALAADQKALEIYKRLARENATVTKHQSDLALRYNDLGIMYGQIGKPDEATDAYRKALEIQERLFRENPTVTENATYLAGTLVNLAQINRTKDSETALAGLGRAISLLSEVLKREPHNITAREFLKIAHENIGWLRHQNGQPAETLAAHQKVIEKLETLARENPIVDKNWSELAKSHMSIGILYSQTGKPTEALAAYQKAVEILESLVGDNPTNTEYAIYLAGNLVNVAIRNKTKDAETALAGLRRAISILSAVLKREPRNVKASEFLRNAHNSIGGVYTQTDKPAEALAAYQKAIEIQERLIRENPNFTKYQSDLATSHNSIGILYNGVGKRVEALAAYQKALEIREPLFRDHPTVAEYAIGVAGSLVNLARLEETKDAETALAGLERAISILKDVRKREPQNFTARDYLSKAHWSRAKVHDSMGAHGKAATDREQVSKLTGGSNAVDRRIKASMLLARDGQYLDAITQADRLAAQIKQPRAIYDLACVYAVCASAASEDTTLNETLRELFSDAYAERSHALLKRAAEAGYFQDKENRDLLTTDKDFAALRDREDFREFLKSLGEEE